MPTPTETLLGLLHWDMDIVMDFLREYPLVNDLLTQTTPYILKARPYLRTLTTQTINLLTPLYHTLLTTLTPLLTTLQRLASQAPATTALVLLPLIIWYIFWVISFIQRIMAWGTRMVFSVVFWGVVGWVAVVVWERGVGRTGAEVWAWGCMVVERWRGEYERVLREEGREGRGW